MKRSRIPPLITALTLLFLYLPIVLLVVNSFNASSFSGTWEGFSLKWYEKLFHHRAILRALRNSLLIGLGATAISTALGTLSALALHRFRSYLQKVHTSLIYAPLVFPDILIGMALLAFFVAGGVRLGLGTILIAHSTFCTSYVALLVLGRLQQFDHSTIEAAQDLGASWWTIQSRVVIPQLLPGITAGALLAFTMSFDDFIITYFVSGPGSTTLPVYIYGMIRFGQTPVINALSTLILLVTLVSFYLTQRLTGGKRP